jgi:beta-phosphoglucomutase
MRKLVFRPKAVIFDMDGVIIDSMPYHFLAWYEALRPYGVRVSCFDVYSKEGERWEKTLKDLLRRSGIKPSRPLLKEIYLRRQKVFRRYFKRFIFAGAEDFISCLKSRGYALGLVTGSPTQEIKKILPGKTLMLFDAVVAGNQVKRGKPHPEPYLKCSRALKLDPKECLVIENAPYGIESARKAGMFCVAVTTSLPKEYLCGANLTVNTLGEISGFIFASCRFKESR